MADKYKHYMLIDVDTGEIVDDAQGYDYHTKQKAHAAWNYQHASSKRKRNRKQNDKNTNSGIKNVMSVVNNYGGD